jgi:hypothetical protein
LAPPDHSWIVRSSPPVLNPDAEEFGCSQRFESHSNSDALNLAAPPYPGAYVEVSVPSPDRSRPACHAQTFEALNPGFETVPAD